MLKIPELAMPRTRKVTTVCNGKREVWTDYEEAKALVIPPAHISVHILSILFLMTPVIIVNLQPPHITQGIIPYIIAQSAQIVNDSTMKNLYISLGILLAKRKGGSVEPPYFISFAIAISISSCFGDRDLNVATASFNVPGLVTSSSKKSFGSTPRNSQI